MLMFEKNGQGFWDFDFELLVKMTSKGFAEDVKSALKLHNQFVYDVQMCETEVAVTISFVTVGSIQSFSYFIEENYVTRGYINIQTVKRHFPSVEKEFNKMGGFGLNEKA